MLEVIVQKQLCLDVFEYSASILGSYLFQIHGLMQGLG